MRHLIKDSVGAGGHNAQDDVRAVQQALAEHGHSPGAIDGQVGTRTLAALEQFQRQFLAQPDRLVELGGATERHLTENARLAPQPRPPERQAPPTGDIPKNDEPLGEAREAALAAVPGVMRPNAQHAIPTLLASCRDLGVRDPNQVAYILATAQHESGFGATKFQRSEALVEDHNPYRQSPDGTWTTTVHLTGQKITAGSEAELEKTYWDAIYGHKLGNTPGTEDAAHFKGRGYVQLTGRRNYADMSKRMNQAGITYTHGGVMYGGPGNPPIDLVANPTHVNLVPEVAAYILVVGSTEGSFTGKSLGNFIHDDHVDFYDARSVINGDKGKNGDHIAQIALRYAAVLAPTWPRVFTRPDAGSARKPGNA